MTLTTIKVPTQLRDRISSDAKAQGVSTATLLTALLDDWERRQRMATVGSAFAGLTADDAYWDEIRDWDAIGAGLSDA